MDIYAEFPKKLLPGLFEHHRYKILHGGRGGGKSWAIARALLILGMKRKLRILCARETQRSIRDSVHKLLVDQIAGLGLAGFYNVKQVEISGLNGTSFTFSGLSDQTADSLKSFEAADVCWVEEGHVVTDNSWTILLPTIFRVKDCELWVSFNPELDTDPTWKLFVESPPPDAWRVSINWDENPFFPDELNKLRLYHERTLPKTEYDWIWNGQCRAAAKGAIYTREMQELAVSQRIVDLPIDPMLKTHTVWDLGFNDQTAIILVQTNRSQLRIVDYIEDSHRTLVDYGQQLKSMPYNWGNDYLPWDGADERFKFTDPTTSPQSILGKLGRKVSIVPKSDVETGIRKARMVFPRCYFDKDRTTRLRECLKRYKRIIPSTTDEPSNPRHDEFSHGADAFRYLALIANQLSNDETGSKPLVYPRRAYA